MIKIYELKDKNYSCVVRQWSVGKIIYIDEDFNSSSDRNVDIRRLMGDLIFDNLCHLLLHVKHVKATDKLRVVEARDICREKLIPLCQEHRYETPRLVAGIKKYEHEIRDLAIDNKSKIWRAEWNEGMEVINRVVDYWSKENEKLKQ